MKVTPFLMFEGNAEGKIFIKSEFWIILDVAIRGHTQN